MTLIVQKLFGSKFCHVFQTIFKFFFVKFNVKRCRIFVVLTLFLFIYFLHCSWKVWKVAKLTHIELYFCRRLFVFRLPSLDHNFIFLYVSHFSFVLNRILITINRDSNKRFIYKTCLWKWENHEVWPFFWKVCSNEKIHSEWIRICFLFFYASQLF